MPGLARPHAGAEDPAVDSLQPSTLSRAVCPEALLAVCHLQGPGHALGPLTRVLAAPAGATNHRLGQPGLWESCLQRGEGAPERADDARRGPREPWGAGVLQLPGKARQQEVQQVPPGRVLLTRVSGGALGPAQGGLPPRRGELMAVLSLILSY